MILGSSMTDWKDPLVASPRQTEVLIVDPYPVAKDLAGATLTGFRQGQNLYKLLALLNLALDKSHPPALGEHVVAR
jgi:hypothetical protein